MAHETQWVLRAARAGHSSRDRKDLGDRWMHLLEALPGEEVGTAHDRQ